MRRVMSRGRRRIIPAQAVRAKVLALLLAGTLLVCHGVFGALHLCPTPHGTGAAVQHAGHAHSSPGAGGSAHDHQACDLMHADSYYAVFLVGLLGLTLLLLLRGARYWSSTTTPRPSVSRLLHPVVLHPPPRFLTLPQLQVFRL